MAFATLDFLDPMPFVARLLDNAPVGRHGLLAAIHVDADEVGVAKLALIERCLPPRPIVLGVLVSAGDRVHAQLLTTFHALARHTSSLSVHLNRGSRGVADFGFLFLFPLPFVGATSSSSSLASSSSSSALSSSSGLASRSCESRPDSAETRACS
jgi:hypothetical protein